MLQYYFSLRQFRLIKWIFFVRVTRLTYTRVLIRFSNCTRLTIKMYPNCTSSSFYFHIFVWSISTCSTLIPVEMIRKGFKLFELNVIYVSKSSLLLYINQIQHNRSTYRKYFEKQASLTRKCLNTDHSTMA